MSMHIVAVLECMRTVMLDTNGSSFVNRCALFSLYADCFSLVISWALSILNFYLLVGQTFALSTFLCEWQIQPAGAWLLTEQC